ncbi:hypothetical protein LTR37_000625 [Vermiconidia calcicola]|uniref:Uncharacterized protein n=1 Tax=Vermiconidia calcicola TaxID=1690605 RepID=A0ACC3NXR0_9PEZI|nr:hypothetical protein LTR37_000625 [Vermiconidia calcicola]
MAQTPTIDRLLNLVPDAPSSVLSHINNHPELASQQDAHGYSLLHAATSYGHLDLLKALIYDHHVDPNMVDEDGETCLFNAESVEFAKQLVELGVRFGIQNNDGQTASEKLDDEDEQPEVAAYLKQFAEQSSPTVTSGNDHTAGSTSSTVNGNATITNGETNGIHPPPPLPGGVQVNVGTMHANEVGGEPDPEFRRRIEELAARQDFEGEEGQRQLRDLIADAVSGLNEEGQGPASRRRLG